SDADNGSNANTGSDVDANSGSNTDMNSNNNSNSDTTSNDNSQNNNQQDNGKQDSKSLPDTGETTNQNGTIFGSLFAAFGSLLLFRRRNKKNEDK
ncbi:LPXTG cell wall anchor domain-containing protein, partial [Staphylococcus gallinarum]